MAISFSHVQGAGAANTDPCSITLGAAPTEGNLLIAAGCERSGGSPGNFTITGTGWTVREDLEVDPADTTYRRSMRVWSKVAGASESSTITIDDGTTNTKTALVVEYSHGSGTGSWTYEDSISADNGKTADATSLASGSTVSIPAGDLLEVDIFYIKRGPTTDAITPSWTNSLTQRAEYGDAVSFGRYLALADYLLDTSGGTKSTTASFSSSTAWNSGLMQALLVFSASEGGAPLFPPNSLTLTGVGK